MLIPPPPTTRTHSHIFFIFTLTFICVYFYVRFIRRDLSNRTTKQSCRNKRIGNVFSFSFSFFINFFSNFVLTIKLPQFGKKIKDSTVTKYAQNNGREKHLFWFCFQPRKANILFWKDNYFNFRELLVFFFLFICFLFFFVFCERIFANGFYVNHIRWFNPNNFVGKIKLGKSQKATSWSAKHFSAVCL